MLGAGAMPSHKPVWAVSRLDALEQTSNLTGPATSQMSHAKGVMQKRADLVLIGSLLGVVAGRSRSFRQSVRAAHAVTSLASYSPSHEVY